MFSIREKKQWLSSEQEIVRYALYFPSKKGGRSRAAQGSIISLVGSQGYAVGLQTGCRLLLSLWPGVYAVHTSLCMCLE